VTDTFQHKKSLGQNFLNSDYVPKQMCDAGAVGADDTVLEIGPGTGALTKELLARGATVIAVEADERAIASLEESFPEAIARGQLTIHHQDARELFPSEFGLKAGEYKVIANIPYYLSGLLLRQLLDTDIQPSRLVFLIQKELAERIARDTKESLLSLSVKVFGEPTYICTVKRGHFTPPPKVDSAILLVENISQTHFKNLPKQIFFDILHLGFGQKRKQLVGNLSHAYPREAIESIFAQLGLEPTVRAEDVDLQTWLAMCSSLHAIHT
jgi:16S rRNA (adenine1518-N6/adenine1519-N6)-dimethyltransferase